MSIVTIRSLLPSDEPAWRRLWQGYGDFHGTRLAESVTQRTWSRILDPDSAISCVIAELDGRVVGFAHCVVHEATRESQPVCHLEDLYVDPAVRRRGVGAALLDWLRGAMRAEGWSRLSWTTRRDNAAARALSERYVAADDALHYVVREPGAHR